MWARDSRNLPELAAGTVALVVTSPPYPMIQQWDAEFGPPGSAIATALERGDGGGAFDAMHAELERTWAEVARVMMPGGIVCINVGDAVRTIGGRFQLFPNHARIIEGFLARGFTCLPQILWRKETNAPNKFMGSGMLPPSAYVTLEHEHILVFRNGGTRSFTSDGERLRRRQSAIFWEERNAWFSDLWTFKGVRQSGLAPPARVRQGSHGAAPGDPEGVLLADDARAASVLAAGDRAAAVAETVARSGAFPFELAFRLVHMFSLRADLVLDPFLGTGTVCLAAAAARRHSIGVERVPERAAAARRAVDLHAVTGNERIRKRRADHAGFVAQGRPLRHRNEFLDTPVMTLQETDLRIELMADVQPTESGAAVSYEPHPPRLTAAPTQLRLMGLRQEPPDAIRR